MIRYLIAAVLSLFPVMGHAQSVPGWKSYQTTGNPADVVRSSGSDDSVAAWMGKKVDVTGGTLVSPRISQAAISASSFTCQNSAACVISSLIQYSPPWAASVERTLLTRLEDTVSVKDFGARGDGITDDEPAFFAATGTGNRNIIVPCGTYLFKEPFPIVFSNIRVSGGMQGCSTIIQDYTSGNGITIAPNTGWETGLTNITVDHLAFQMASGVTKTSGASIQVISGHKITLDNNTSRNDYIGFDLRSGPNQFDYFISNNGVDGASYAAFLLTDNGDVTKQVEDVYMINNAIGGGGIGYLFLNASGVIAVGSDICCGTARPVVAAPGNGQNVNALYLTKFWADQFSGEAGFDFPNDGGFLSEIHLADCWGSGGTGGHGLLLSNTRADNVTIDGFEAHANYLAGIDIEAGKNILIHGAQIHYNSQKGSAAIAGILVEGSSAHVTVSDTFSGVGGFQAVDSTMTNNQSLGLLVSGQASDVIVHDSQFFGNVTAGYNDDSANKAVNIWHDNLNQ